MLRPDVVLVFAFGCFDGPHSSPNKELKNYGFHLSESYWIPAVMPQSIYLTDSEWMWSAKRKGLYVISEEKYLSTSDYVLRFANLAEKMKWEKVLVVAAAPHRKRCIRDLLKMDFTIINLDTDEIYRAEMKSIKWYNRESKHWQTRHPLLWWPRELLLRATT